MAPREVREGGHLRREDSCAGEGAAIYELQEGDENSFAWRLCSSNDCGLGTQEELAQAFGRHVIRAQYIASSPAVVARIDGGAQRSKACANSS